MKYLIILPVVHEEITDKCIKSIDKSILENLIIVDNSVDKFAKKYQVKEVIDPGQNIGVGRAWNIGAKIVLKEKLDYLIILSATVSFSKGMADFIKYLEINPYKYGLESQHSWHLIAIGRKTLEEVGLFDENFYPAYYEDSDYIRRMELAGIHNPMSCTVRLPKVEIMAGFAGNAHGMKKAGIKVNMGACLQYFIDKWGYEPRYENQRQRDLMFRYPFNNPENSLKYWSKKSIEKLISEYNLVEEQG